MIEKNAPRVGERHTPRAANEQIHAKLLLKLAGDSAPDVTFPYVARALARFGLAYLHVIEPRVTGNVSKDDKPPVAAGLLRPLFGGPVIAAGGFDKKGADAILRKGDADLVAFGRDFLANPDLPERLRRGLPLNHYDRTTFYYGGSKGYVDYPPHEAVLLRDVISHLG